MKRSLAMAAHRSGSPASPRRSSIDPGSTPMMQAVPLTAELAQKWDTFVLHSGDAWLFHLTDWIRIESTNEPSVSFAIEAEGQLAGVFPLYLSKRKSAGFLPLRVLHTGRARSG